MTPQGRPETIDELNGLTNLALSHVAHGHASLWSALVNTLIAKGVFEPSDLAVNISQSWADQEQDIKQSPLYRKVVSPAIESLVLCEYPTLQDAPEWIQKMVRGELAVRADTPANPEAFKGSEGPR